MANGNDPNVTVVERSGGGGAMVIGLVLLVAVIIGAIFLFNQQRSTSVKDAAITQAARDVGGAASKVGDSATKAADKVQ